MLGASAPADDDIERPAYARGKRQQRTNAIHALRRRAYRQQREQAESASPTQRKSIGRRDANTATANGPVNSIAVARPSGTVRSEA